LANDLAAAYHAAQPHIVVDVEPMGNAAAATLAVRDGHSDLALSTAPPAQEESAGLRVQAIAQDGLALVVHRDNPLAGLDFGQAAAIFHGDIADWSRLGGPTGPIEVYARESGAGPRTVLEQIVLDGRALSPMALVVPGEQELLDAVAGNPRAVGLVPVSWLDERVKPLTLNGASPEAARQTSSGYPLLLPIYLLSARSPSADVVEFQRFVRGREGQAALTEHFAPAADAP
jgi:phosphate transport system substrate-binding protein